MNGIRSLSEFGNPRWAPSPNSALPPSFSIPRLALKLFRREPAISKFVWNFSATHTSSPHFSTYVGSVLQCVLPHTPLPGCFSPFPHGTGSLSVTREYLALRDGPRGFRRNFSCSAVLRILLGVVSISSTGLSPSLAEFSKSFNYTNRLPYRSPTTPTSKLVGLGSSRFARRYSGNRIFFLFLQVLRCFSSLRLPLISYVFTEK